MGVVVKASVRRPDAVGLLPVAILARNSCSFVRQPTVQSTNVCERFGAPGFREVCFSGAAEDVVTQATRSRRRANVWFGFHGIRSDSRRCRCRSVGYARKSGAGSRNVDVRVQHAIARFWGGHAFCVLANAFCIRELLKDCFGRMPKPARCKRALRRANKDARSYSPSRRRNCALAYSRLSFAMKLALILAGHTASHS